MAGFYAIAANVGIEGPLEKLSSVELLDLTSLGAIAANGWRMSNPLDQRALGGGDRLRRADMHPDAFEPKAEQAARLAGPIEQ